MCNNSGPLLSSPDTDQTTQKSLEAYFQHDQQRHSFALNDSGNLINREYFQTVEKTRSHFIHQFGKAKNNLKTSGKIGIVFFRMFYTETHMLFHVDELIQSSYCQWNHHHFFANIYPTSRYHKVSNKVTGKKIIRKKEKKKLNRVYIRMKSLCFILKKTLSI